MLEDKNPLSVQILSLILQIAFALALSFLGAVLVRDSWNWFVAPPTGFAQIGYPAAFGIYMAISAISILVATADLDKKSDSQAERPFSGPIIKAVAKALAILIIWGVCAIAHAAIG